MENYLLFFWSGSLPATWSDKWCPGFVFSFNHKIYNCTACSLRNVCWIWKILYYTLSKTSFVKQLYILKKNGKHKSCCSWSTQQSTCCSMCEICAVYVRFYGWQLVLTTSLDEVGQHSTLSAAPCLRSVLYVLGFMDNNLC